MISQSTDDLPDEHSLPNQNQPDIVNPTQSTRTTIQYSLEEEERREELRRKRLENDRLELELRKERMALGL
jgi:hypothetical protein